MSCQLLKDKEKALFKVKQQNLVLQNEVTKLSSDVKTLKSGITVVREELIKKSQSTIANLRLEISTRIQEINQLRLDRDKLVRNLDENRVTIDALRAERETNKKES